MVATKQYTAADVIELGGTTVDHLELFEGELIRMPPATPEHGWIGGLLFRRVGNHAEEHRLGEVFDSSTGYFFSHDPDTLLQPDLTFVRADRLPPRSEWQAFSNVVPDLVVEVISPSEPRAHIQRKIDIYLAAGVRLVWIVRPMRQTVTVYAPVREPATLGIGDELDGEDVLPGFRLSIASLFQE